MLKPSMNELMDKVDNRYLLVNLAAQRARDIADEAEQMDEPLMEKAVKLALDEIAAGVVQYREGAKPEKTESIVYSDLTAAIAFDLDEDGAEAELFEEEEE